jgi:hypothetical protein
MRHLNALATPAIVGFIAAVVALAIQGMSNGAASGAREAGVNLALPALIGLLAAVGAFVLQSKTSSRRKRRRRA